MCVLLSAVASGSQTSIICDQFSWSPSSKNYNFNICLVCLWVWHCFEHNLHSRSIFWLSYCWLHPVKQAGSRFYLIIQLALSTQKRYSFGTANAISISNQLSCPYKRWDNKIWTGNVRPLLTVEQNQNPKTYFWIGFGFGQTDAKTMLSVFGKS